MLQYQTLFYVSASIILILIIILIIFILKNRSLNRKFSEVIKSILSGINSIKNINSDNSGNQNTDIRDLKIKPHIFDTEEVINSFRDMIKIIKQNSYLIDMIIDNTQQGIMIIDRERKILKINNSLVNLFYLNRGDVLNSKTIIALNNEKLENQIARSFEELVPLENDIVFFEEEEKHLEVETIPVIFNPYSNVEIKKNEDITVLLLIFFRNVTPEVEFSRLRSQFVDNISHEMRTPLTSIGGYLETILGDDSINQEKIKDYLSKSLREVERLNLLIKDVLDLSNIEYRRNVLFEKEHNLIDIIKDVIESLSFLANQNNIKIDLKFSSNPINYQTDEELFRQMVRNIIENSIFYAGDGAKLDIDIKEEDSRILLIFKDNGIGISKDELPYIFQRFYRGRNPGSSKQIGSGLGLSIVKHIVNLHRGKISVSSIPYRETRFSIFLSKQ
ncbi:MAG: ATP-binding protein [Actinomycetota bacterium]